MIRWLNLDHIKWIHHQQLKEYGGLPGLRDLGVLESSISSPMNMHFYENVVDIKILAAVYAIKIISNHPFVDGNKRTGIASSGVFLSLNGYFLDTSEQDLYNFVYGFASHEIPEQDFIEWMRMSTKQTIM